MQLAVKNYSSQQVGNQADIFNVKTTGFFFHFEMKMITGAEGGI